MKFKNLLNYISKIINSSTCYKVPNALIENNINVLLCETEGNDTYYTFAQIVIYNTINTLRLPLPANNNSNHSSRLHGCLSSRYTIVRCALYSRKKDWLTTHLSISFNSRAFRNDELNSRAMCNYFTDSFLQGV